MRGDLLAFWYILRELLIQVGEKRTHQDVVLAGKTGSRSTVISGILFSRMVASISAMDFPG